RDGAADDGGGGTAGGSHGEALSRIGKTRRAAGNAACESGPDRRGSRGECHTNSTAASDGGNWNRLAAARAATGEVECRSESASVADGPEDAVTGGVRTDRKERDRRRTAGPRGA